MTFLGYLKIAVSVLIVAIALQMSGLDCGYFSKYHGIDARLKSGHLSYVMRTSHDSHIERPKELKLITETFMNQSTVKTFGIVLGPVGTGKSYLTRLACTRNPSGAIHHEIVLAATFPKSLARTVGMRLREDTNLFDILLEIFGVSSFFSFPQTTSHALAFVLENVANRAIIYRKAHGIVPCIFIDGVDLLATTGPELFVQLVDHAKFYANLGHLCLVLVSSEGQILPLMNSTSSFTRSCPIVEILDINFEDSKRFVANMQKDIPDELMNRIFNLTGGRFIYLISAVHYYRDATIKHLVTEDVFPIIEKSLLAEYYLKKVYKMYGYRNAREIMNLVFSEGTIHSLDIVKSLDDKEAAVIPTTITKLVELNLLRYNELGLVTLHSQLVYYGMRLYGH